MDDREIAIVGGKVPVLLQVPEKFEAVHARHDHIRNDDILLLKVIVGEHRECCARARHHRRSGPGQKFAALRGIGQVITKQNNHKN